MDEQWKDVKGWEGFYRVSTHGRVYSVPRLAANGRPCGGKLFTCSMNSKGYRHVRFTRKAVAYHYDVARLVAMTFIPNPLNLSSVLHIDGDRGNAHVDNLRWADHEVITRHALNELGTGYRPVGDKNWSVKLTEDQVREIRKKHKKWKYTQRQLAEEYGVSQMAICRVVNRVSWKHIA